MTKDSQARSYTSSRRGFLKEAGLVTAGGVLAGAVVPAVHAAENNTIQLAIIGCGGRGSGAVGNALSCSQGPTKLVAMADVFQHRLDASHNALHTQFGDKIDVPKGRQFIGFDAYKKAIDCLRPGDVALLTTHSAFRPLHLEYAISKGVHVFMEKNFASDPAGAHKIRELGKLAEKKNLKIGAGVMCRHSAARKALIDRIRNGDLGQIQLIRAYRMDGGYNLGPFKRDVSEVLWQLARAYMFYWVSSGIFLELMIHQIDECCWIKDGFPVSAHGVGGRRFGSTDASPCLDSYAVEYTFADGTKAQVTGRYMPNCFNDFATYIHGTKCGAQFSGNIHAGTVHTYNDQRMDPKNINWKAPKENLSNLYIAEWDALLGAIRNDRPHNESERAAFATLTAQMGRAAVHMGRVVTWDEMMKSRFAFCPNIASLNADSPSPTPADKDGRYQPPVPGVWNEV